MLYKIHNLMLNCNTKEQLKVYIFELGLDNLFNDRYNDLINNIINNPVLAAETTILPTYYLKATQYGMKQDRLGNFYKLDN